MEELIESIKENEGFISKPYIDILVKKNPEKYGITKAELETIEKHIDKLKLTFGFGFTYIEEDESEAVTKIKLKKIIKELENREPYFNNLPLEAQSILAEMAYQLGVSGLLKFKKMWVALKNKDAKEAAKEGLDSAWAKQTPNRANKLMSKLAATTL